MSESAELRERLLAAASEADVATLLRNLPAEWKVSKTAEHMGGDGKARAWRGFEFWTWQLGETLRQTLAKKPRWKRSDPIMAACIAIVEDAELLRGRQPFLELIARYGGEAAHAVIVRCIADDDVVGHAIKAARIAGVAEARDRVLEAAELTDKAWVRREAKKYLAKHPA